MRDSWYTDKRCYHNTTTDWAYTRTSPYDYERYFKYVNEILESPDYILEANKPNTAFILKHICDNGKNYQLILRLKTSQDPIGYKNSVITFLKVDDKRYNRYLRTKKILYKNE